MMRKVVRTVSNVLVATIAWETQQTIKIFHVLRDITACKILLILITGNALPVLTIISLEERIFQLVSNVHLVSIVLDGEILRRLTLVLQVCLHKCYSYVISYYLPH